MIWLLVMAGVVLGVIFWMLLSGRLDEQEPDPRENAAVCESGQNHLSSEPRRR